MKTEYIRIDHAGSAEYYVGIISGDDGTVTDQQCFVSRERAEGYAARLANQHKLEWETNYCPF